MNRVDRWIQRLRVTQALRWLGPGERVLDVGCADGALFRQGFSLINSGVGIDSEEPDSWPDGPFEFRHGTFPEAVNEDDIFDAVTMLAVVEHVSTGDRQTWAEAVPKLLRRGGRLIVTVPSPMVDRMLEVGIRLRLLDGMDTGHHHGMDPKVIPSEFGLPPMRILTATTFELGLNHLLVFERT